MRIVLAPWRRLHAAYARRLSWKLALSHLTVALICQLIYIFGAVFILVYAIAFNRPQEGLPLSSREMSEETRILAAALAAPLAAQSAADLAATLARLPPTTPIGLGAFDGVLSPANTLVIVAPDGAIIAASAPSVVVNQPVGTLDPPVWGAVLTAALQHGATPDPALAALRGRDTQRRVLVTAYPIVDNQGRIIGALGLRSAPVPLSTPINPFHLLASVSAFILGLLLVVGTISSVTSSIAGFLLARSFGRRLRPLEVATETIARGDLEARVTIDAPDEIGRLGERFNLLTARLDETDRARRVFVSNVSHELRTPLAIIRGHVEAQLAHGAESLPRREALETIDREARALGGLIDDLFTLTRIEESALPVQPAPVAVGPLAAEAVAGIRALASAQGHVAVHSVVPPDLPPALADRDRLGQILNNLLYNALRHTPAGGVIVVEGRLAATSALVEIAVTDTGTGIAAEDVPHIFTRFYHGEGGSSGLGLAIVKQLVEAQGGTVWAESTPGQGTSIRFTLPCAPR